MADLTLTYRVVANQVRFLSSQIILPPDTGKLPEHVLITINPGIDVVFNGGETFIPEEIGVDSKAIDDGLADGLIEAVSSDEP